MNTTIAEAARAYAEKGWKPIPIGRKSKKPTDKGWQKRPFDPAQFNGNAQNVAIQLGAASNGLCDVDIDCMDAIGFAPEFLPPTGAIFGHRSKPCSHQLYVTDLYDTEKKAAIQFQRYHDGKPVEMIVELRVGGDGKGATTTVPPSMHAGTGELVQWVSDGDPARVDGAMLKRTVLKLAVACMLKPNYPAPGGNGGSDRGARHEAALVLGGVLARAGWQPDDIRHVMEVIARAVGDGDVRDRVETAAGAVEPKAAGIAVPGLQRLAELWGEDCAGTLGKWLPTARATESGESVGLEDRVALEFAEQHIGEMRYVAKSSQWMRWTGGNWQTEDTLAAFDESRTLCRAAGDSRAKTVAAVVTLARSDRRMAATADQWDAAAKLFNTRE